MEKVYLYQDPCDAPDLVNLADLPLSDRERAMAETALRESGKAWVAVAPGVTQLIARA